MGINRASLLHDHNGPSHLRVNGAKITMSAGSARCDCELLICVERGRFLKLLLDAHDGVRFLVPIDPGDLFAGLHCDSLRIEGEVFDLYFVFAGADAAGVFHLAGERKERRKTNSAQKRCDSDSRNKRSHSLSR